MVIHNGRRVSALPSGAEQLSLFVRPYRRDHVGMCARCGVHTLQSAHPLRSAIQNTFQLCLSCLGVTMRPKHPESALTMVAFDLSALVDLHEQHDGSQSWCNACKYGA